MAMPYDDFPHPVPPVASLRWKENWLFIVMDTDRSVYGLVHINSEPAFDRVRFTCNFSVAGALHKYGNEIRYPQAFAWSKIISDGAITLQIQQPGERFLLSIDTPSLGAKLFFSATFGTFDFAACRSAAPHNLSFRELMTLGTNLQHDHHQQALAVAGEVWLPAKNQSLAVRGHGYRDHSYCMRGDSLIAAHTWNALLFKGRVFGIKTAAMLGREGAVAREGYVDDGAGGRVLVDMAVEQQGDGAEGLGEQVLFTATDLDGLKYRLCADLNRRYASLPFQSEKPGAANVYQIIEALCPVTDLDSGEVGVGHIELGINSALRVLG